jgi:hypothetical protein
MHGLGTNVTGAKTLYLDANYGGTKIRVHFLNFFGQGILIGPITNANKFFEFLKKGQKKQKRLIETVLTDINWQHHRLFIIDLEPS